MPTESDIKSFVIQADKAPAEVILDDSSSRNIQRHAKEVVSSTVQAKSGDKVETVYKSYQARQQ